MNNKKNIFLLETIGNSDIRTANVMALTFQSAFVTTKNI